MMRKHGYSLCTVVYGPKLFKFSKCVQSWIDNKNTDDFEINIACNGLDSNLTDFLHNLELKYDFIHVFYFSQNIGASKGLNTCFLASKYRYVVKLDDDILIPKENSDWLQRLEKCLNSDPNVAIVTGVAIAASPTMQYAFDNLNLHELFYANYKKRIHEIDYQYRHKDLISFNESLLNHIEEFAKTLKNSNDGYQELRLGHFRVMGCLVFMNHATLVKYGVLKENFGLHGQDDIEFDRRLLSHGMETLTDTGLYYHHWI